MAGNQRRSTRAVASRVVPGSYREVTVTPPGDEVEEEVVDDGPALVAEAPRSKRIRSKPKVRQVRVSDED